VPLPADLTVRELGPDDLPEVVALVARCDATYRESAPAGWQPPDPEQRKPESRERLGDPQRWSRGAFDAEGRLVATAAWEQFNDRDTGENPSGVAHVSAVFVDPSRWRQGIASALLSQAEQAMRDRDYYLARLWTPEIAQARHFYERHGWHYDGRRKWHDRLQLHIVGYEKPLTPPGPIGHHS
jgi:GNAT superfamily N-acetyltransferase